MILLLKETLARKIWAMASLTLGNAQKIIRETREKGKEMKLKPLSTVVLDAGGHVIAFE